MRARHVRRKGLEGVGGGCGRGAAWCRRRERKSLVYVCMWSERLPRGGALDEIEGKLKVASLVRECCHKIADKSHLHTHYHSPRGFSSSMRHGPPKREQTSQACEATTKG